MSSSNIRDAETEDLLERIKHLKELLKSEELREGSAAISQSSRSRVPNSGHSSPSSSKRSQRHFSPPSRNEPLERSPAQTPNKDLIEETWHLLTQVTYVRIVIDRLTWDETPRFLLDELRRPRTPRQKNLMVLEYWFPTSTSGDDGSISSRVLGKKVVVPAKDVLPKVAHFNHRRVVLLRMTQPLLQLWSQSSLTIRILSGKKLNLTILKCTIPLCKLLMMPFSFDADVHLESANDHVRGTGTLKLCIQLGSRFRSFSERVEPMRNPTTAVNEYTFIDPMKLLAHVPVKSTSSKPPPAPPVGFTDDEKQRPTVQRETTARSPVIQRETTVRSPKIQRETIIERPETSDTTPYSSPSPYTAHLQHHHQSRRFEERRMNETFCKETSHERDATNHDENWRPISLKGPFNGRGGRGAEERESPVVRHPSTRPVDMELSNLNISEPYVSNISVYGNRPMPLNFGYRSKTASVQTEPTYRSAATVTEKQKADAAAQTSTASDDTSTTVYEKKAAKGKRRLTVAEKILMNRSSFGSQESLKLPPERNHGFWLQLTFHRSRNLPMVKETKSGHELIKPSCYWTYCSETGMHYSPITADSLKPVWEWSSKLFVPPQRKSLILKLWHRGNEGRDRVIGFVAILFPISHPFERVWYEIIDLTRSSTGQVELSFAETTPDEVVPIPPHSPLRAEVKDDHSLPRREEIQCLQTSDRDLIEKATTSSVEDHRRSSSSSPFIALTSRSFLSQKLRTNLDELATMTSHLRRCQSPATPRREWRGASSSSEALEVEELEQESVVENVPAFEHHSFTSKSDIVSPDAP